MIGALSFFTGGTTGSNGSGIQFATWRRESNGLTKTKGLGHEIPLDWFTQNVHP